MKKLSLLALLFLLALPACGKSAEIPDALGPVTVKVAFWGSPEEIKIITDSVKEWEKAHPGIKIRFEHTPYSGYLNNILTRIAGGAAPDIIATEVDYFVSFAKYGVLEPLNSYVDQDSAFKASDFFPQVIRRFTVDGNLYAIPRDTAPFACVYYNKDLFDKEGIPYPQDDWTWSEFLEAAKKLTKFDAKGRATQYGFYGWAWKNFVYGNGGAIVDNVEHPTKTLLNTPESIEGLQFYVDLINKHKVMPTPVALADSGMGVDMMFEIGKLGMFLSGVWETPTFRTTKNLHWDVAMFPKNDKGIRGFGTGGTGYAILKSSAHKKEAWEVVKALTGPEGQIELAKRGLAQPARIEIAEGPAFALDKDNPPANKGMLNEAVQYVVYDPFSPAWREIEAKFLQPVLDLLFNGQRAVQDVVKEIAPQIDRALTESARQ
jgi:ABC-type glycerol-3-phosphate transport system substrate-binding protein